MKTRLEIRDSIHGFIHRRNREQQIIDTPLFQRLRRIKQLALASLVYPGALHTRFEHSIGCMHIAGRVSHQLQLPDDEQQLLRLTALVHDIGHGPFSHVSEEILKGVSGKKQAHELLTFRIIKASKLLAGPLSDNEREEIVGILEGTRGDSLSRGIISGPLDVDKQDYLLRDSYFCGVKYGVYDLDRLIETLRIHKDKHDRSLAVSEDGVHTLEQFVIARYHMTSQVYRHRVRLISDSMIVRGIELGISHDKITWLKELYAFEDNDAFLENYLSWDDERLIKALLGDSVPQGYAKEMFERLVNRNLFKQICRLNFNDFDPVAKAALLSLPPADAKRLERQIESAVASVYTEFDENLVLARVLRQKSVASTEGSVLVICDDGTVPEFREKSTLFRSIDSAIHDQFIDIYAPVAWKDDSDRAVRKERYQTEIFSLLNDLLKAKTGLFANADAIAEREGIK